MRAAWACAIAMLSCGLLPPAVEARSSERTQVEAAFSPGDDIAGLITERIARARKTVQMHAYIFTDRRIANALLAARKRGVEVEVVGDAAQFESGGLPHLKALQRAGARVYLNAAHSASHNKIVIIDGTDARATVITGSYNFTQSAQSRNAENVVVISGNRRLAERFTANFEFHRGQSHPWP